MSSINKEIYHYLFQLIKDSGKYNSYFIKENNIIMSTYTFNSDQRLILMKSVRDNGLKRRANNGGNDSEYDRYFNFSFKSSPFCNNNPHISEYLIPIDNSSDILFNEYRKIYNECCDSLGFRLDCIDPVIRDLSTWLRKKIYISRDKFFMYLNTVFEIDGPQHLVGLYQNSLDKVIDLFLERTFGIYTERFPTYGKIVKACTPSLNNKGDLDYKTAILDGKTLFEDESIFFTNLINYAYAISSKRSSNGEVLEKLNMYHIELILCVLCKNFNNYFKYLVWIIEKKFEDMKTNNEIIVYRSQIIKAFPEIKNNKSLEGLIISKFEELSKKSLKIK